MRERSAISKKYSCSVVYLFTYLFTYLVPEIGIIKLYLFLRTLAAAAARCSVVLLIIRKPTYQDVGLRMMRSGSVAHRRLLLPSNLQREIQFSSSGGSF